MTTDLHTIAYISRNAVTEGGGDLETEIERILEVARVQNKKIDVTGALLYSGGCFAQVLEGQLDAVEGVFEKIQCDSRHRDVRILHFKQIEERSFGQWSMAFAGLSDDRVHRVDLAGIVENPETVESGEAGRDVVTVLSRLIAGYEGSVG